ncbi:MAG TPA: hypothetical protein VF733_04805 [Candidatus Saccharimonadales bacterium]
MSEFIVLGLVPGTQLQITFLLWLVVVSLLTIWTLAHICRRVMALRRAFISVYVLILSRKRPSTEALWSTI